MTTEEINKLGIQLSEYCAKYGIPIEYVFEILEDQKVTPMIRGKAMEFNAYLLLKRMLSSSQWDVQKLNLNPQPGIYDEDITITHRRTGIILKAESKSAVRGSISLGTRARVLREPHFKVKCHRSRSNIKLSGTTNDKYQVDSFDILLTNPLNAIYEGNTIGESLQVIPDENIRTKLIRHYAVPDEQGLIDACSHDWRFCIPEDIAVRGFIPRTPYVKLERDENWQPVSTLDERLLSVVEAKKLKIAKGKKNQTSRRS